MMTIPILTGNLSFFTIACLFAMLIFPNAPSGQAVHLPNPSFEDGASEPTSWQLSPDGKGRWLQPAEGIEQRAVSVIGNGTSTSYWRSSPIQFAPGQSYALSFYARSLGSNNGSAISGPRFCNRDLGQLPAKWTQYRSIFTAPAQSDRSLSFFRFGQWKVLGEIAYDELHIAPVQPIYARSNLLQLGEGESLTGGRYSFSAPFNGPSANHSRPLSAHTCNFNTNRWVFGPDSNVEYHHVIKGHQQLAASIEITLGHYESGRLIIEASNDQNQYAILGQLENSQTAIYDIPSTLLPSTALWIRLRSAEAQNESGVWRPGAFQVVTYNYTAQLDGNPPNLMGHTYFATLTRSPEEMAVHLFSLGNLKPSHPDTVTLSVHSKLKKSVQVEPTVSIFRQDEKKPIFESSIRVRIDPGTNELSIPYMLERTGDHTLHIGWDESPSYSAMIDFHIPDLYAAHPGYLLPMHLSDVALWQIDSGWKVDQRRPPPTRKSPGLYLSAAGGEREAIQLVLRPERPIKSLTIQQGRLSNAAGDTLGRDLIDVLKVAYVPIAEPSDALGSADYWPDPLLPLAGPVDLREGINHPFWIRINVPEETPSGLYEGTILLSEAGHTLSVPLTVRVYGFSLPRQMSCSTALGFSFSNVVRYHNLSTEEDKRRVLDLYLKNFSAHRISPYDPAPLDRPHISWNNTVPQWDWTAWDRSMEKAIHHYGFNSFRLPVLGLGSGDHSRLNLPQINGFREEDPRYDEALQRYLSGLETHLKDKGWLDEAYVYFFDEPRPIDYPFVNRGFAKLARHAPNIRRMLTEQVEEALVGGPNIWCPLTSHFQPHLSQKRRAEGDIYWWYICTQPKAPYAGLFIDRAGLELRTWLWQTWQQGIEGILIWQSNYWHSEAAYAESMQNPYTDPMSWISRYSVPTGTRRPWGNGDGRFIYPPLRAFSADKSPIIEGPIDSHRWEMLRDGIEDYEYFSILSRLLADSKDLSPAERLPYTSLLKVPETISVSPREFNRDPTALRQHRHALAQAIESLKKIQRE